MLRILFLNTWGGVLWDRLRTFVMNEGPEFDILCLSEVHRLPGVKEAFMTATQPGSRKGDIFACQYDALKELLPVHDGYYSPHAWYCLHDLERVDLPVYYGNALFVKPELPTISFQSGMAFRRFNQLNDDSPAARSIQGVIVLKNDKPYVVVHFHGLWAGGHKDDTDDRLEQSRRVSGFMMDLVLQARKLTGIEPRVILGGDMNLTSQTRSLRMLAEADAFKGKGRILNREFGVFDTRTSHYGKNVREADFIIASSDLKVISLEAPAVPEISDHRPLIIGCQ